MKRDPGFGVAILAERVHSTMRYQRVPMEAAVSLVAQQCELRSGAIQKLREFLGLAVTQTDVQP